MTSRDAITLSYLGCWNTSCEEIANLVDVLVYKDRHAVLAAGVSAFRRTSISRDPRCLPVPDLFLSRKALTALMAVASSEVDRLAVSTQLA